MMTMTMMLSIQFPQEKCQNAGRESAAYLGVHQNLHTGKVARMMIVNDKPHADDNAQEDEVGSAYVTRAMPADLLQVEQTKDQNDEMTKLYANLSDFVARQKEQAVDIPTGTIDSTAGTGRKDRPSKFPQSAEMPKISKPTNYKRKARSQRSYLTNLQNDKKKTNNY